MSTATIAPPVEVLTASSWHHRAACLRYPADLWFPASRNPTPEERAAIAICLTCPVIRQCAASVLAAADSDQPIQDGIWAGIRISYKAFRDPRRRESVYRQFEAIAGKEAT